MVAGLRAAGWTVTVHALDPSFPKPSAGALAHAHQVLASLHADGVVVIDGLALGAMPQVVVKAASRLRLVALVHHPLATETGLSPTESAALERSERRALAAVRRVIVTSRATARQLAAYAVPAERIKVVEPGTEPAPPARGSGSNRLELLCVAAITPRKGHSLLVEALARLADRSWRLTCVGSLTRHRAAAEGLEAQIRSLGLADRVTLTGEVTAARVRASYERADGFVLATHFEGYGMALAEALAHGLPIVATRAGAIPDTVPPGASLLVPPGDLDALTDALSSLLDDPALRRRLGAKAWAARAALPTWHQACTRFAAALGRVGRT
jgi:glycosyltransferase involved in cell wall biosynthesis